MGNAEQRVPDRLTLYVDMYKILFHHHWLKVLVHERDYQRFLDKMLEITGDELPQRTLESQREVNDTVISSFLPLFEHLLRGDSHRWKDGFRGLNSKEYEFLESLFGLSISANIEDPPLEARRQREQEDLEASLRDAEIRHMRRKRLAVW